MEQTRQPQSARKNALFARLQFLIKDFCKIIWLVGRKVITLHRVPEETTETNQRTARPNELRASKLGI